MSDDPFSACRADIESLEDELSSAAALHAPVHEIEQLLESRGREVLRAMMQAHLDLRSRASCDDDASGLGRLPELQDSDQLLILRFTRTAVTTHAAAVYSLKASPRTVTEVLDDIRGNRDGDSPRPIHMRVCTSSEQFPEQVIEDVFAEALRRDPERRRRWVVLVDGNQDQLRRIQQAARTAGVEITIVLELVRVIEWLWRAAHAFHPDAASEAERWVERHLERLLRGHSGGEIATRLRLMGKTHALKPKAVTPVREAARYLATNARWLHYDRALADGLPIGDLDDHCQFHVGTEREQARASRDDDDGNERAQLTPADDMRGYFADVERTAIVQALAAEDYNQTRAARRVGLSRRAFIYKMEKYGLKPRPNHSEPRSES